MMNFYDAVYHIANRKGISIEKLSLSMGHTAAYIAKQKCRGSLPKVDTAAKILSACGYSLCVVPKNDVPMNAIVIRKRGDEQP